MNNIFNSPKKDLYALRRKKLFVSEDAAKVRVMVKNSFDEMFFGEEAHNPKK